MKRWRDWSNWCGKNIKHSEASTGEIKPKAGQEEARLCVGQDVLPTKDSQKMSDIIGILCTDTKCLPICKTSEVPLDSQAQGSYFRVLCQIRGFYADQGKVQVWFPEFQIDKGRRLLSLPALQLIIYIVLVNFSRLLKHHQAQGSKLFKRTVSNQRILR